MRDLDKRYHNDPYFHQLVDLFFREIIKLKTTPDEIRDAAMFAQIKYEMENPRRLSFSPQLTEEILHRTSRYERDSKEEKK